MNGMTWFSLLTLLALTYYLVSKLKPGDRSLFIAGLTVKCLAGVTLGLTYMYYYDGMGDTLQYWNESSAIAARMTSPAQTLDILWSELPDSTLMSSGVHGVPRSFFFSKVAAIISWFTGGNYWMMAVVFSFISFLAAWKLFLQLQTYRIPAAVALFFFPSVVFWSSGLIKESLGLASIYVLVSLFLTWYRRGHVVGYNYILGVVAVWVGWNLKYYWLGILAPVLLATISVVYIKRLWPSWKSFEVGLAGVLLATFLLISTGLHPNFYPERIAAVIVESNAAFVSLSEPAGIIHFDNLQPQVGSLLWNAPWALFSCLFRPWIGEARQLVSMLAALENTVVLVLLLLACRSIRSAWHSPDRLLTGAVITYTILLAVFLALSSPNLGTLSRYKVGFLPFLVMLLLEATPEVRRWLGRLIPG
ncbi:MAG TPA: hypothetical protein PLX35_02770 [Cyclobacteriaceae bacterium]|nr:hypothetical protein [Cyclobacteriaceae bacterium]